MEDRESKRGREGGKEGGEKEGGRERGRELCTCKEGVMQGGKEGDTDKQKDFKI